MEEGDKKEEHTKTIDEIIFENTKGREVLSHDEATSDITLSVGRRVRPLIRKLVFRPTRSDDVATLFTKSLVDYILDSTIAKIIRIRTNRRDYKFINE